MIDHYADRIPKERLVLAVANRPVKKAELCKQMKLSSKTLKNYGISDNDTVGRIYRILKNKKPKYLSRFEPFVWKEFMRSVNSIEGGNR